MQTDNSQLNLFESGIKQQKITVFDIETQRGFHEIKTVSDMGVAVAVSCNLANGEYKVYKEDNLHELIDEIFSSDVVIGYNIVNFDYAVLRGYTDKDFSSLNTIDMMRKAQQALGYRPKLDNLTSATLGAKKSADGLQSLRWYKQGRIDKIIEYCTVDVRLTKELYEFGRDNGYILADSKGQIIKAKISW